MGCSCLGHVSLMGHVPTTVFTELRVKYVWGLADGNRESHALPCSCEAQSAPVSAVCNTSCSSPDSSENKGLICEEPEALFQGLGVGGAPTADRQRKEKGPKHRGGFSLATPAVATL